MTQARIPTATYRLQFNSSFTFTQAAEVVPYLHDLGISHCYASPYLKARAGSPHGYDIVDHNALNPEIGDWQTFEQFVRALDQSGMGQILDIVPNHMGVGGDDNAWWLDVLENGEASRYASYFDIDWRPIKEELRGKVLLPVLGDHYGTVLESGELKLGFDAKCGEFSVRFYSHRFPIDPSTYPRILGYQLARLRQQLASDDSVLLEFESLITAFQNLPPRWDTSAEKRSERLRDKEIYKQRLAELVSRSSVIAGFIGRNVETLNGVPDTPGSFDHLHDLLELQPYRLAYWQVAADEINYRRFFDINELAGLRMEHPEVFDATHRLVLKLIAERKLDGLRIDHPDGLYDPMGYYGRLHDELKRAMRQGEHTLDNTPEEAIPCYLVVEKILASYEYLPEDWPVHGTTGYDFAYAVNALFVYSDLERDMERLYTRFVGRRLDFDEVLYERKKLIIRVQLSSELNVLANFLYTIAQRDRHTRDFTLIGLRESLREVVACFPVYRTYITGSQFTPEDRRYVEWAVAQAKKRSPAADITIFNFVQSILLQENLDQRGALFRQKAVEFTMKFQQYTAPVMAKALEDTTFYVYNRLISLNEVGSDPRRFGLSVAAFHHANQERARRWAHSMLATSTHDTKRSEDVRARINVLSELAGEWRKHLGRWSRVNRAKKRTVEDLAAPARNDEYLLYQTLVGAWPLEDLDEQGLAAFRKRIEAYMLKAAKEAKVHTSWINPNTAYEEAVVAFVRRLLGSLENNAFLADFLPFQGRVSRFGLLNSLSQALLKFTSPGVPDIYQGNELWDFSLVDPDNRRPVDYLRRREMLESVKALVADAQDLALRVRGLVETIEDGRAKLYLTWRALNLRRQYSSLFQEGDYVSLGAQGNRSDHICAFARAHEGSTAVAAAPRWFARLSDGMDGLPLGDTVWADTWVEAPNLADNVVYENVLTGERLRVHLQEGKGFFSATELLSNFPVALLIGRGS